SGLRRESGKDELMGDVSDDAKARAEASSTGKAVSARRSVADSELEETAAAARNMKIAIAFDYMRLRIGDIAKMSYFTPALRQMFKDDESAKDEGVGKPTTGSAKAEVKKKLKEKASKESMKPASGERS
ncbi:MAG: hypothetical protein Q9157_008775, partial [Trypethelium eluteriae]